MPELEKPTGDQHSPAGHHVLSTNDPTDRLSEQADVVRTIPSLLASLVLLWLLAACSGDNALAVVTEKGRFTFSVEVVDTPESRAQGLMFRQNLAPDAGMLFDFKQTQPVSFWMRNTLIPLDIIFIRADGTVANVHVNARPLDPTGIPSDGPVMFVLEIPGGRSVDIGLAAGDRVEHPRIARAAREAQ